MVSIKFHFKEIDWVIYIPICENKGKNQIDYLVTYRNRKSGQTQKKRRVNLQEVINKPEIDNSYPHSIGVYLDSSGRGKKWIPEYLLTKKILNNQGFVKLLNSLKL
ncbi:hypothetical protein JJE00_06160 [Candidatus Bathyarchaeota archaeon]|nr:hypothetical protein [Candidatus Bathyarchaeota archaeon]